MTYGHRIIAALVMLLFAADAEAGEETKRRFWPTGEEWRRAAVGAIRDPDTWIPATGAAAVALSGWDDNISEWAREQTPLFGSNRRAEEVSDDLQTAAHVAMFTTALLVRDPDSPWRSRFRRVFWQHVATDTAGRLTNGLKRTFDRDRPDGADELSFPSGHATRAFAYAAGASRNLEQLPEWGGWNRALDVGTTALAAGTGWARIEGGKHYPTDVLVGAALGNAVSLLIQDAFLHRYADDPSVSVRVEPDGWSVAVRIPVP